MTGIDVTIFGLELILKPIAFTISIGSFNWDVYWYGIIIALGFMLALIYGYTNAKHFNIDVDRMLDVVLVAVPVAILSARTYYIIFDGEKLTSFGDFFGFGDSSGFAGLAIYGGVIGAFVSGGIMCKLRKVNILDMFDLASIGFLIGQCVGRWGNFVNQEAFGSLTGSSWWGMESIRTQAVVGEGLVHPCFLYESIWCFIGFILLHKFSKKRQYSGQIVLMYCAWYGLGRAFIELLRTDSLMLGIFKVSSLLSFLLCITASTLLIVINKRKKATQENYSELFADPDDIEETDDDTPENEITEEVEENEQDN
jgi:phosphatidylglycerol:prolipoprotein diacylglycerol transferase